MFGVSKVKTFPPVVAVVVVATGDGVMTVFLVVKVVREFPPFLFLNAESRVVTPRVCRCCLLFWLLLLLDDDDVFLRLFGLIAFSAAAAAEGAGAEVA